MSNEVYTNPITEQQGEEAGQPLISLANLSRKKLQRHELRFQTFHYILVDDWLKKLGNDSYCLYLELITMADRSDVNRDMDKLPTSMKGLMKRLNISKGTFYKRVKPLYEYGFIDFIEYTESKLKGQKPVNIVVFEAPWNEESNMKLPLVKLRSWEDRTREQYPNAIKGGKKKTELARTNKPAEKEESPENEDTPNLSGSGKKNYPGSGTENYPGSGKENYHNNVLNNINNSLNPINNSIDNLVNKEVSNEVSKFAKYENDESFINAVLSSSHGHMFKMTHEYGMTKDKFVKVVTKFATEVIERGEVDSIKNLDAYVAGFIRNLQNHHESKQRLADFIAYQQSLTEDEDAIVYPHVHDDETGPVDLDEQLQTMLREFEARKRQE